MASDNKTKLVAARRRKAAISRKLASLPRGESGTRSSNPQFGQLQRALAQADSEIRKLRAGSVPVKPRAGETPSSVTQSPGGKLLADIGGAVGGFVKRQTAEFGEDIDRLQRKFKAPEPRDPDARTIPGEGVLKESVGDPTIPDAQAQQEALVDSLLPDFQDASPQEIEEIADPQTAALKKALAEEEGKDQLAQRKEQEGQAAAAGGASGPSTQRIEGADVTLNPEAEPGSIQSVDPQLDQIQADLAALKSDAGRDVPKLFGPVPMSMGARIAAGLIAAIDPVRYQAVVLPELARRQAEAATRFKQEQTRREFSFLQQAQIIGARAQVAGLALEQQKVEGAEEERELARKKSEAAIVSALGALAPTAESVEDRFEITAQAARANGLTALADNLDRQRQEAVDLTSTVLGDPRNATEESVTILGNRINKLDSALDGAQDAIIAERARKGKGIDGKKIPSFKNIEQYAWGRSALRSLRRARSLVKQGHGGPESFVTGVFWWSESGQRKNELAEEWANIEATIKPSKFGGALSPTENEILDGILADANSNVPRQLRDLDRIEEVIASALEKQEAVFELGDALPIVGRKLLTSSQLEDIVQLESEGWVLATSAEQLGGAGTKFSEFEGWLRDNAGYPIMLDPNSLEAYRILPF